jgi:N-glycosylase/DNA lyase
VRVALEVPPRFDFRRTVHSHGWFGLAPFHATPGADALETVVAVPGGAARRIRLEPAEGAVLLRSTGRPRAVVANHLKRAARRILNLDLRLDEFHRTARGVGRMPWIAARDAGRMLRCPTVFEDLVKMVLTTNCSWSLTTRMVGSLVERYGERCRDGGRAFPGPEPIARAGERELREKVRAGYRAPSLAGLARRVADGTIDPGSWAREDADPAAVREEILSLPGAGPYVADSLLRLLGRPSGLGLDSWLRSKYARVYHGGRKVTDRTIARRYARFGGWGGLALWCDMTRDWTDGDAEPDIP